MQHSEVKGAHRGPLSCKGHAWAQQVLHQLPSGILVCDASGRVLCVNRRAQELLGMSDAHPDCDLAEVLGRNVLQEHCRLGGRGEQRVTLADGRERTIGYSVASVDTEIGQPAAYAVCFTDISSMQELRVERDRLLQLAAISDVLPTVLHELKNPLAAVTALVEVLLEEMAEDAGSLRQDLHAVLSELRRLKLGFDGLAAVGRSLSQRGFAAIDLACREAARLLAGRAQNARLFLRTDVENMPLLPLDPNVIRALVFNLVVNAIQACKPGDTVVVHARLHRASSYFELTVVDNGCGMQKEVYDQCTKLFFSTKSGGSGIGLTLCRQAAESAGGEMTIDSLPNVGTSVAIRVPIQKMK